MSEATRVTYLRAVASRFKLTRTVFPHIESFPITSRAAQRLVKATGRIIAYEIAVQYEIYIFIRDCSGKMR